MIVSVIAPIQILNFSGTMKKKKDPKFTSLKAKIARMSSSEGKEYLKKFVYHQAEKEMAKRNKQ